MKLLGVILMIISFPLMFFFILGTELAPDTFNGLIETLLCRGDETYNLETSSGYRPGLTYIDMTCISPGGSARDVTLWYFAVTGTSFIIPFMLGLMLLMRGLKPVMSATIRTGSAPGAIRINNQTLDLDALMEQARSQPGGHTQTFISTSAPGSGGGSGNTLADRLRQLQEAYDAGLLTQAEYENQRRQIMRDFSGG